MFPDHNVHYIRHYNVGYSPLNIKASSEYRYRYSPTNPPRPEPRINPPVPDYQKQFLSNSFDCGVPVTSPKERNPYSDTRRIGCSDNPGLARELDAGRVRDQSLELRQPIEETAQNFAATTAGRDVLEDRKEAVPEPPVRMEEKRDEPPPPAGNRVLPAGGESESNAVIRDPYDEKWAALLRSQDIEEEHIALKEEKEHWMRTQRYRAVLDQQLRLREERSAFERRAKSRDRHLAVLRNSELEKLELEHDAKERQLKEVTRKEYDREIEERRRMYGNWASSTRNATGKRVGDYFRLKSGAIRDENSTKEQTAPFYLLDVNKQRFRKVPCEIRWAENRRRHDEAGADIPEVHESAVPRRGFRECI